MAVRSWPTARRQGMRFDNWETVVQPILAEHFAITGQPCFCVLPSYTQVARTSLFAGCLPSEWRGYTGRPTKNETTLVARNLGTELVASLEPWRHAAGFQFRDRVEARPAKHRDVAARQRIRGGHRGEQVLTPGEWRQRQQVPAPAAHDERDRIPARGE